MSAPQTLVQAAINRLTARLGSGLVEAAAGLAVLAQDAPERLRREWDLFREEVELEVQRLEQPGASPPAATTGAAAYPAGGAGSASGSSAGPAAAAATGGGYPDPQQQVDDLRATVARLARRLDGLG